MLEKTNISIYREVPLMGELSLDQKKTKIYK